MRRNKWMQVIRENNMTFNNKKTLYRIVGYKRPRHETIEKRNSLKFIIKQFTKNKYDIF